MVRKLTVDDFILKASSIHKNKYDYSLVDYKNNHTKVKIICPIHGIFEQTPYIHLMGCGCQKCGIQKRLENPGRESTYIKTRKSKEYLIEKSKQKHNNKYSYDKVKYTPGSDTYRSTKVEITCPKHGSFWKTFNSHIGGVGCPKCAKESYWDLDKHNVRCEAQRRRFQRPEELKKLSNRMKDIFKNPEVSKKVYLTKKKNHSHSSSKPEKEIYNYIKKYYPNAINGYMSDKYPYNCDIYIPELDQYIELNFFWTHGTEPYNPDNPKHLKKVEEWKRRSNEINFKGEKKSSFIKAIDVWTKRDVEKVSVAGKNNLNFVAFYNKSDFYSWFNLIK